MVRRVVVVIVPAIAAIFDLQGRMIDAEALFQRCDSLVDEGIVTFLAITNDVRFCIRSSSASCT